MIRKSHMTKHSLISIFTTLDGHFISLRTDYKHFSASNVFLHYLYFTNVYRALVIMSHTPVAVIM